MNSLSWLIYAADALGKLSGLVGFMAFGVPIVTAVCIFMVPPFVQFDVNDGKALAWRLLRWGGIATACAWVPYVVLPSNKTIWLIAASEAGEAVVTSPDAIEMMGDLKAIIKQKLKDELGEGK